MKDPDYALAMYVMLSRARKLEDLWLVDLPPRHMFESFLLDQNPLLVERMTEFQELAARSEESALRFPKYLGWIPNKLSLYRYHYKDITQLSLSLEQ